MLSSQRSQIGAELIQLLLALSFAFHGSFPFKVNYKKMMCGFSAETTQLYL